MAHGTTALHYVVVQGGRGQKREQQRLVVIVPQHGQVHVLPPWQHRQIRPPRSLRPPCRLRQEPERQAAQWIQPRFGGRGGEAWWERGGKEQGFGNGEQDLVLLDGAGGLQGDASVGGVEAEGEWGGGEVELAVLEEPGLKGPI